MKPAQIGRQLECPQAPKYINGFDIIFLLGEPEKLVFKEENDVILTDHKDVFVLRPCTVSAMNLASLKDGCVSLTQPHAIRHPPTDESLRGVG